MTFFKLIFLEIEKEFLKRKKIFLIFLMFPFLYLLYPLKSYDLSIFEFFVNQCYVLYISIILFFHIDAIWNFINFPYGLRFYLLFPFKKYYVLLMKLFSIFLALFFFLFIFFLFTFFMFKNFFCIPLINSIIFMSILFIIISLFSFFKFPHFPLFSFIIFYILGIFIRPNLLKYDKKLKYFVNVLGKILPPLDSLFINNYNFTDILISFLYIVLGIFLSLIIFEKKEF